MHFRIIALVLLVLFSASAMTYGDDLANYKKFREYVKDGKLVAGEKGFDGLLQKTPQDNGIRVPLGVLQFLRAIEGLGQDYYRYGLDPARPNRSILMRMPIPNNPNPEEISYDKARSVLQNLLDRLSKADKTLSDFKPSGIKIPIAINEISLDLDSNGKSSPNEAVWGAMGGNLIEFAFDDADVFWLRGYINVLSSVVQFALAHDWQSAFERTAHLFFPRVQSPFGFFADELDESQWASNQIFDFIAFIHVIDFKVIEPDRMTKSLEHFEKVIQLSRETWRLIREETDNDREWLPGKTQTSIVLAGRQGNRMGDDWERVLNQVELVLQGKELLPFWRGVKNRNSFNIFGRGNDVEFNPKLGINLRQVFTNPQTFDLVLWIQGTGVAPFLESGKLIDFQAWSELSDAFQGNLPFFAFWIN
jgi:hypothetical protein